MLLAVIFWLTKELSELQVLHLCWLSRGRGEETAGENRCESALPLQALLLAQESILQR